MKFVGHRFVFAAAAAFLALAGKGDDAVGVMSIDAGTNGIVEAEMPFDAVDGNRPTSFTNTMAIPCNTMGSCLYDYE
jgi:hypothetical protein